MAGGGGGTSRQLDQTPTWAVAGVCAVIIIISIALEKIIHKLGTWLTDRHKKALYEALEKVKAELMILGFISLTLVFSQYYIAGICIPSSVADTMLPCPAIDKSAKTDEAEEHRRRLLWYERRILAGAEPKCKDGRVSLISVDALHQIHILIFFLAVLHVIYSAITMWLGKLKKLWWRPVIGSILFVGFSGPYLEPFRIQMIYHIWTKVKYSTGVWFTRMLDDFWGLQDKMTKSVFSCFIEDACDINQRIRQSVKGRWSWFRIRGWKGWEQETSTHNYEFSNDPSRFRLTHETSFVRAHTSFWTRIPIFFYIGCFFRQFFRSVNKSDYLTLRNGFISVHLAPGSKFNFQKYIKRSLEDDYKVVVGVSPVLWGSFVVFLLLNVSGWHALFWASLVPMIIILAVGTKLQAVLTRMALDISERHAVVQGIPLVQGSDKYFWFGRPQLVLHLIHFALFQNAFQITYFLWIWYEYGLKSCFHDKFGFVIAKIALGVGVLFLCSYITLPLYALITQMGSNMKKSIFDEQTSKALKKWHMAVKKKAGAKGDKSTRTLGSGSPRSSVGSPLHSSIGPTLHRFKTTGHSTRFNGYDDLEASDLENDPTTPINRPEDSNAQVTDDDTELEVHVPQNEESTRNEDDFSFSKPAPQR